ncbi:hypothetical protein BBK82_44950 [Lentzea guizhouensis]|uniref:Uncharacterized protein n=1 Tax=Lentzea guizhouensis TaxID=1586287 RepID=A0A1B2HWC1_9PSEU|nr:hypothetical protein BBK82_44950 [Lentzea guizhouensis]
MATMAGAVLAAVLICAPQAAAAPDLNCGPIPIAVAQSEWQDNVIGIRSYAMRVKSEVYPCGGYVRAVHYVSLDASRLPLGTTVRIFVGTRRSDGKWYGGTTTMSSSQNISARGYVQVRGLGGGLRLTHVRLGHFAESGQAVITPGDGSTARYVPWNGPEAKPGNR